MSVLTKFREGSIVVVGDIEKMFCQINVNQCHVIYQKFLWFKDNDVDGEIEERFLTHFMFGAKPSPTVAIYAVRQTAKDHVNEFPPSFQDIVANNFYFDDAATSTNTIEEAKTIATDLPKLLNKGGFHLTKLLSNHPEVNLAIPPAERAKSLRHF